MRSRSAIWSPLAVLALLALLSMWIDRSVQPPKPKFDGSGRHDPDYKVSNFNTVKTDEYGNPRNMLAAVEMLHFPDDDSTQLLRPRFTQYSVNKPYTQIQAQHGLVSSNGENVYFMDNVKAVRAATPQKGELTLQTDYLHIIPDKDLAVTDHPVTILQAPHTVIRATGMELNKKERTLKLFKRVYVHYEKPETKAATPKTRPLAKPLPEKKPNQKTSAKKPLTVKKPVEKKPVKKSTPHQPTAANTTTRVRRHYETAPTQP